MSRSFVSIGWDDVPHLSEKAKAELASGFRTHERNARMKGEPSIGAGAVYRTPKEAFEIEPFELPVYWPRAYGLDVGWNKNAALWAAHDRESDTIYVYSEMYLGEVEPPAVASAIRARGAWIPGLIDPASRGRAQRDGVRLIDEYRDEGLQLQMADNAVEAGIHVISTMLQTGRLKVFNSCANVLSEYSLYRRDKHGKIVKTFDHALDALRYLVTGMNIAVTQTEAEVANSYDPTFHNGGWHEPSAPTGSAGY
jgi:hypothetical protein